MGATRRFLFLQGPIGPFFRHLSRHLRRQGHSVKKINFWGGDLWDYPTGQSYKGPVTDWPVFFEHLLHTEQISDLVLFGDHRPAHRRAIPVAQALGVRVHVFEEGYFRPDWITLDQGGANANSGLPRRLTDHATGLESHPPPSSDPVGPCFWKAVPLVLAHYTAGVLLSSFFPHYEHHRLHSPVTEGLWWLSRFVSNPVRQVVESLHARRLLSRLGNHFVFPLQLEGDVQVRIHSDFSSVQEAVEEVISSFCAHGSGKGHMFIKPHPLDPHPWKTRRQIQATIRRFRAEARVHWIDVPGIGFLLHEAKGLITINSTAGLLALRHGVPTKVLGRAFWNVPELTDQGSLNHFWHTPRPPDAEAFAVVSKSVMVRTQKNGGFYSKRGREMVFASLSMKEENWS